jgi:hypothetical protein
LDVAGSSNLGGLYHNKFPNKMAIVAAELVEMGTAEEAGAAEEAGTSSSTFKSDSAENAAAQGVDVSGLGKLIGPGFSLAMSIASLIRSERKGSEEAEERKENRYRAGVVFEPEESRNVLVQKGLMPAYYSSSNIRALLADNKLPYGWSEEAAIKQGFGTEIRSGEFRRKNKMQIDNLNEYYSDKLALSRQLAESDSINRRLRLNRALQQLRI